MALPTKIVQIGGHRLSAHWNTAIRPIERTAEAILDGVMMGHAQVDESLCLSYQGKTCGVCYRACPLPDVQCRNQQAELTKLSQLRQ